MRQKKKLIQILVASVFFVAALLLPEEGKAGWGRIGLFIAAYLLVGLEVVFDAVRSIFKGRMMDENFLMAVASIGAFCLGDFSEAVVVMLLYAVGEWFQSYAVNRSRKSIQSLMDIRPDFANVIREGKTIAVDPEEVEVGEEIVVRAGERIPLDGVILEGTASLDTSALTGEALPREAAEGEEVLSGSININGTLRLRVEKEFGQSTVAKILDMVENASSRKADTEQFITKFARYYTPAVVGLAAVLAVLPPLLGAGSFGTWIYRAMTFLVISCPCALVISVPLSFFGGIGGASKLGILLKGSNSMEALSKVNRVCFDKTGTLTKGNFRVSSVCPAGEEEHLPEKAAYCEYYSNHPIAKSILEYYDGRQQMDPTRISEVTELPGFGLKLKLDGREMLAGNRKLMEEYGVSYEERSEGMTTVYFAEEGSFLGSITIEDEIKEDSERAIRSLKECGVRETVMLTGDTNETGQRIGSRLGLDRVYAQLLPDQKVEKLEEIMRDSDASHKTAYVGDGINDAPVLARADIGIAMGGVGSDAAIEAADVVIMTDEPSKIPVAKKLAARTMGIVKQNIVFAIGVKVLVLILGALGYASVWMAVFADVGVAFLAILNAMRALDVSGFRKAE